MAEPTGIRKRRQAHRRNSARGGAVIVELAIVLPILVLLMVGSIEVNRSIFLKQTLTSAALDGVLVGLRPDSTEQDVINRVNQLLLDRDISAISIAVETESGNSLEQLVAGEVFAVVVTAAPEDENIFLGLTTVDARITGVRSGLEEVAEEEGAVEGTGEGESGTGETE